MANLIWDLFCKPARRVLLTKYFRISLTFLYQDFMSVCYAFCMKNFDKWNEEKKKIDVGTFRRFYHVREIWWCYLGENIGYEHNGTGMNFTRPVLVVKTVSRDSCLIIPLTSSSSSHKMRIRIDDKSSVVVSQIRIVDVKRFSSRICKLKKDIFDEITKAIREMF